MKRVFHALIETAPGRFATERAKVLRLQDLRIPIHIALGAYESATPEELDELISDLQAERSRRP